ncbi:cytochrome P450 [Irpex lacteus]|nr:cytochrome P450 [Irpex lacteus]
MGLYEVIPALNLRDVVIAHIASSLTIHYVFKRWEPSSAARIALLLVAPPLPLALLLAPHVERWFIAVAVTYSLFWCTLSLSVILYRLSPFHPLARYPGPLLCKVSKWWMIWETRGGTQHRWCQRLHRRYGDVVRTGPNELSFCDASIIPGIMGTAGFPKGPGRLAAAFNPSVHSLIMYRDPVEHARRRKPWNRAFNSAALKEYHPKIAHRAAQLVDSLASQKGIVDLATWISLFAYDFMGDMAFGGGSAMMENGDGDDLWHLLRSAFVSAFLFEQITWLPHIAKYIPALRDRVQRLRNLGIGRAKARYEAGAETKDLFYYLSNEDGAEKQSPPKEVVVSDGTLALVAGSDTTSIVLAAAFWCILTHPETYKRLREEVDKYYPPGEDSTSTEHHPRMVYLEAVINETLRMFPPVPSGSARAPLVGGGDRVAGQYFIPEGTITRMHIWSMHRDPRNFTQPERFWPERWLIAEGLEEPEMREAFVHNVNAFIPFSFGPANCVGKNLAMQEMRTVLCHVTQTLHLELPVGWNPVEFEEQFVDYFAAETGKLPVIIQRREL